MWSVQQQLQKQINSFGKLDERKKILLPLMVIMGSAQQRGCMVSWFKPCYIRKCSQLCSTVLLSFVADERGWS